MINVAITPKPTVPSPRPKPYGQIFARHDVERRSDARADADVSTSTGKEQANNGDNHNQRREAADAKRAIEHHTQRRTGGHGDIGSDPVPGNDAGSVDRAVRF